MEWSPQIQTGFHVSGPTQVPTRPLYLFAYGAITLYRLTFQRVLLRYCIPMRLALQPREQCPRFRLFPVRSPLLRESLVDFFSSAYLDVSVRQVRFRNLCIQLRMIRYYPYRVTPFGHPRVNASSGSPRLFAGSTSFFACQCQGIHQQPLKA
jgi:hypothetical protein